MHEVAEVVSCTTTEVTVLVVLIVTPEPTNHELSVTDTHQSAST